MNLRFCGAIIIFTLIHSTVHSEDKLQELTRRVEMLEKQNEEFLLTSSETPPPVYSFFNNKLTIGGFFEPSYTMITGPDTRFQAGSYTHLLGLNFSSDISNKFRFVSQFLTGISAPLTNPHNDPRAPTVSSILEKGRKFGTFNIGALVAQGYVEYAIGQHVSIQAGLGYVPLGHYAQLREPVLFKQRNGPQILRTANLFAPLWMGFNLIANIPSINGGYNIYTAPSVDQSSKQGGGVRFWKSGHNNDYTFGLSSQIGRKDSKTYEVFGTDFKMQFEKFDFVIDYITQVRKGEDPWAVSVSPTFYIHQQEFLLYLIVDYASSALNRTGSGTLALMDPYRKWEYGTGVNWLPTSFTRYRVGFIYHDYVGGRATLLGQNRDYISLDFSVGVAF